MARKKKTHRKTVVFSEEANTRIASMLAAMQKDGTSIQRPSISFAVNWCVMMAIPKDAPPEYFRRALEAAEANHAARGGK